MDRKILEVLKIENFDPKNFDHFDYIQIVEKLDEQMIEIHPHRRKIIKEFL